MVFFLLVSSVTDEEESEWMMLDHVLNENEILLRDFYWEKIMFDVFMRLSILWIIDFDQFKFWNFNNFMGRGDSIAYYPVLIRIRIWSDFPGNKLNSLQTRTNCHLANTISLHCIQHPVNLNSSLKLLSF